MKVIDIRQRTEKWHAWRKTGLTASAAAMVLNRSSYRTRWWLWAELTGFAEPDDLSNNPFVIRGNQLEDSARRQAEEVLACEHNQPVFLLPICAQSDEDPLFIASLDGILPQGEPVELKCPCDATWDDIQERGSESKAYQEYYPQVQHQILVSGAKKGYLFFYREVKQEDRVVAKEYKRFDIERDDVLIAQLRRDGHRFMDQVLTRTPPEADPDRDLYIPMDEAAAREWSFVAEQLTPLETRKAELRKELKALEDSAKPLTDQLKRLMGNFRTGEFAGIRLTNSYSAGPVNYQKAVEDLLPEVGMDQLAKYRKASRHTTRVTVYESELPTPRKIVAPEVKEVAMLSANRIPSLY